MKDRNSQLKSALGAMATKERVEEVAAVPVEDTVNRQGFKAYSLSDELRLIMLLNTVKVQPQFYRTENDTMKELRDLIERIALKDPYFVCQAIVYSRCAGEGMRTINHLGAALVSPFIAGQKFAKAFYGAYNKKASKNGVVTGGTIFRVDDMSEIKAAYEALTGKPLSNAMKKGFASVIENLDTYQLAKYKKTVIDIANLVHPNSSKSEAVIDVDGETMKTLDALMKGLTVTADTHEAANSEAGQEVAKAVREGKLTKDEAEKVLAEAKADNWESLLKDNRLGVLAALRNIRNIMKNPRRETIEMWCKLITNKDAVRAALILPIHFDLAYEVVMNEFANIDYSPMVQAALQEGYQNAIPNLAEAFTGKTCVIVDCSGSMGTPVVQENLKSYNGINGFRGIRDTSRCSYKAGLIAATFAKGTNADVIKFGNDANYFSYNKNENVFSLAKKIGTSNYGGTDPRTAFNLITNLKKVYDRIIFISDNEMNGAFNSNRYYGCSDEYKRYMHDVCSPYIYNIDLAAYGTVPLKSDKVSYYYGYGPSMYEDIVKNEFNPQAHIDKVRAVVIDPDYLKA